MSPVLPSTRARRVAGLGAQIATLLLVLATALGAREDFVLRVGHLVSASGFVQEDAVLVVRDGRIEATGRADELELPDDLPVIHEPDVWAMPGLVAAAVNSTAHRGPESIGAAYRAIDNFDAFSDPHAALRGGVTTIHIHPGEHRLVTGQGAVVKLGGDPQRRVLRASSDLCIQLGDLADTAPAVVELPFPASSDVAIELPQAQEPGARIGRLREFTSQVRTALSENRPERYDFHRAELGRLWREGTPLRVRAPRSPDQLIALRYLENFDRSAVLVVGPEAARNARALAGHAVVYRPVTRFSAPLADVGSRDAASATDDWEALSGLGENFALGVPAGESVVELRLAAIAATAGGLDERTTIASITTNAARVLGVGERVGQDFQPGFDADIVLLSAHPLDARSQVQRVYINGEQVYASVPTRALVVRAGTIWVDDSTRYESGEMLIEAGKIVAIGKSVARPTGARIVDAGPDAVVTPGFIDFRNHVELGGDRSSAGTNIDWRALIGVAGDEQLRLARAGITTTVLAPYATSSSGSRLAAVKTAGTTREARVLREIAGVRFAVSSSLDPTGADSVFASTLSRGKKYLAAWQKYEKDLAEFLEKKKRGETTATTKPDAEERVEKKSDAVTGIWEGTASGGPIQGSVTGKVALSLDGSAVEGRVIEPDPGVEHRIVLTLQGNRLTGSVEVDTGGMGTPKIDATLEGEDAMRGTVSLAGITIEFSAKRIEKKEVEFRVTRSRSQSPDGRPLPPRVDQNLEPIKALLEKKVPAVVEVSQAKHIEGVIRALVEREKIPLVLAGAASSTLFVERLAKDKIGVILTSPFVTEERGVDKILGETLSRGDVDIGFESHAGDGARNLRLMAMRAVQRGLSADAALAAFTSEAARMLKLDDRIGSLAPGHDGDLVIFSGHPFSGSSRVLRVFVNGEEVE